MSQTGFESLLQYRDAIYAPDLLVCAVTHLDLVTLLSREALNFEGICQNCATYPRPTAVMLTLLRAMNILERENGRYRPTPAAQRYLNANSPDSLVPYYRSIQNRPQCLEFFEVLKSGKPAGWSSKKDGADWLSAMQAPDFAQAFTDAMDSRGKILAEALAEALPMSSHSRLLDIAGGSGIYACKMVDRHPHMQATILEIPPVDAVAQQSIKDKGFAGRVSVQMGDMFQALPEGYDVHLFANVFHDWALDNLHKLAQNAYSALPPQGCILVFDAHLNTDKDGPLSVAAYSCLLMHSTLGRCYGETEITETLCETGFRDCSILPIAADRSAILGFKQDAQL